jgi:hypothetical protein
MDYKNGKIYKVQFDDGHFYFGSTAGTLRHRFWHHTHGEDSSCNRYVKEVGKDTCRIVLVEDYPCENKDQLRRKEDEHIQLNRENEMCLNIRRAFTTPEEKKADQQRYDKAYYETHREEANVKAKSYHETHKEECKAKAKAYYETHKEEIKTRMKAYRLNKKQSKIGEA